MEEALRAGPPSEPREAQPMRKGHPGFRPKACSTEGREHSLEHGRALHPRLSPLVFGSSPCIVSRPTVMFARLPDKWVNQDQRTVGKHLLGARCDEHGRYCKKELLASYWISWKMARVSVGRGLKKTETALRSLRSQGLRTGAC